MKKKLFLAATAAGIALALSACGGDDDTPSTPAATAAVPASASASVDGLIAYLKLLVASGPSADTLEPVDTSTFKPMTSDTTEPSPIT